MVQKSAKMENSIFQNWCKMVQIGAKKIARQIIIIYRAISILVVLPEGLHIFNITICYYYQSALIEAALVAIYLDIEILLNKALLV